MIVHFNPFFNNRPPGNNSLSPEFDEFRDQDPHIVYEDYDYIDEWGESYKAELEFHFDPKGRILIDKVKMLVWHGGTQGTPHPIYDEQFQKIYQAFPQYEFI